MELDGIRLTIRAPVTGSKEPVLVADEEHIALTDVLLRGGKLVQKAKTGKLKPLSVPA